MTIPAAANTAINHYLSKGISKDVAVGICAVLMNESTLNPLAENNSGTETGGAINPRGAYGIAQWNGPRQQPLANFAAAKNEPVGAFSTQLDFVLTECANSYPAVWAAIRQVGMTYANFIPIFVEKYENPANPSAEIAKAMANAEAWYGEVSAIPTSVPVPVPPSGAPIMNPALLATLEPLFDALMASFVKALLSQVSTATSGSAPTTSLANSVANVVVPQLATTIQQIIAAELAKLPGAKPT